MSEQSNSPSPSPSNTVQKKKSFRNRNRKSSNNLKAKVLDQNENGKKVNSDKIPKKQVNKENNDNKKPEIEKKEVDKKKNRYHKKKSVNDIKKEDSKSDTVSDTKSDTASNTNEKQDLKKSASKQFLNQKKKRKSKMNLKNEKKEEEEKEDNTMKDVISFMTLLSMQRDEMEREDEELAKNPPPQPHNTKPAKKPYNKANKPKKEIPHFNEDEIKRVLDCYDFPVAYRTPNLIEIFKEYEGSFSWIWINDSRILFIFDTEETAKSAYLAKRHGTNYKLKPYENPTTEFSPYNDDEVSEDENESENEYEEEEEEENDVEEEINENEKQDNQSMKYTKTLYSDYIKPKSYNQSKQESKAKSYNYNQLRQESLRSKSYSQPKQESLRSRSYNQLKQESLESKSYNQPKQPSQDTQEQPVRRQRPVTSDVVARRLISSALGIKPKEKTAEEKEIDRKKFEEARAQRLAARLERQKRLQENSDIFNE